VHKLGVYMNEVALAALQEADLLLWLVSADQLPSDEDRLVASRLKQLQPLPPVILALNKNRPADSQTALAASNAVPGIAAPG